MMQRSLVPTLRLGAVSIAVTLALFGAVAASGQEDPSCQVCRWHTSLFGNTLPYCDDADESELSFAFEHCEIKCTGIWGFWDCLCILRNPCDASSIPSDPGGPRAMLDDGTIVVHDEVLEAVRRIAPPVAMTLGVPLSNGSIQGSLNTAARAAEAPSGIVEYRMSRELKDGNAVFVLEFDGHPALAGASGQLTADGQSLFLELETVDGELQRWALDASTLADETPRSSDSDRR